MELTVGEDKRTVASERDDLVFGDVSDATNVVHVEYCKIRQRYH